MKTLKCSACGSETEEPDKFEASLTELNVQQYHDGLNAGCKDVPMRVRIEVCPYCGLMYMRDCT